MYEYTTHTSGVHAANIIIQMFKGVEAGLEFLESMRDTETADKDCDGTMIVAMLRAERLACDLHLLTPHDLPDLIGDGIARNLATLTKLKKQPGTGGERWGIVHTAEGRNLDLLISCGLGEYFPTNTTIMTLATGEAVQMRYQAWPLHKVFANVRFNDKESEASYADSVWK